MHLKQYFVKAELDLKTEKIQLEIVSTAIQLQKDERISVITLEVHDPGLLITSKLQQRSIDEGGIVIPRELFQETETETALDGDKNVSSGDLASVQAGLVGDPLARVILAYARSVGVTKPEHQAYILATADHESGMGIYLKELGGNDYFTRLYERRSDLGNTQSGDGAKFAGRGLVQITGRRNYTRWGKKLNIPLDTQPELAQQLKYAIPILVLGMKDGDFTGKKLSDYDNDYYNARRIINGTDRADYIAGIARKYYQKIQNGELKGSDVDTSVNVAVNTKKTIATPTKTIKGTRSKTIKETSLGDVFKNKNINITSPTLTAESEAQVASDVDLGYPIKVKMFSNDPNDLPLEISYYWYSYQGGDNSVTITGRGFGSKLLNATSTKEIRTYTNTSIKALAMLVAEQSGYLVGIEDSFLATKIIPKATQLQGESTYQLLVRQARLQGMSVRVVNDGLLSITPLYSDQNIIRLQPEWFVSEPNFSDEADSNRILKEGLPPLVEGYKLTQRSETAEKLAILGQQAGSQNEYESTVEDGYTVGEGFTGSCSLLFCPQVWAIQPNDVITMPASLTGDNKLGRDYRVKSIIHRYPRGISDLQFYVPVWVEKEETQEEVKGNSIVNVKAAEVVRVAESYVGTRFNGSEQAQCAIFVRHCFSKAGQSLGVSTRPYDNYLPTSEAFANSLAGTDIGALNTNKANIKAGDMVFFANTYGDYPSGTITHVGLAVSPTEMVDRPTSAKPVQRRPIDTFPIFSCSVTPTGIS